MWYVYKMVEILTDEILYIGCTSSPQQRRESHRCDRFSRRGYLEVISRHRLKAVALRKEKHLIRKYDPPFNRTHKPSLPPIVGREIVVGPTGVKRSLLVRDGMLPVEKARKRWLSRRYVTQAESCDRMPGWTIDRARRVFGPKP